LSTHAIRTSEGRGLRWLDLLVLALALPLFLAAGLPLLAWGAVTATWLLQRLAHDQLSRRALAAEDPRRSTLLMAVGMMARVWVLALVIFGVGAIEREAGLAAAVLSILLVTAYLISVISRGAAGAPGLSGRGAQPERWSGEHRSYT
jgi:hypothetical protein